MMKKLVDHLIDLVAERRLFNYSLFVFLRRKKSSYFLLCSKDKTLLYSVSEKQGFPLRGVSLSVPKMLKAFLSHWKISTVKLSSKGEVVLSIEIVPPPKEEHLYKTLISNLFFWEQDGVVYLKQLSKRRYLRIKAVGIFKDFPRKYLKSPDLVARIYWLSFKEKMELENLLNMRWKKFVFPHSPIVLIEGEKKVWILVQDFYLSFRSLKVFEEQYETVKSFLSKRWW